MVTSFFSFFVCCIVTEFICMVSALLGTLKVTIPRWSDVA